jgi:hypothetical protein
MQSLRETSAFILRYTNYYRHIGSLVGHRQRIILDQCTINGAAEWHEWVEATSPWRQLAVMSNNQPTGRDSMHALQIITSTNGLCNPFMEATRIGTALIIVTTAGSGRRENGSREEAVAKLQQVNSATKSTSTLTKYSHFGRVTTKCTDIGLDPPEGQLLIHESPIATVVPLS